MGEKVALRGVSSPWRRSSGFSGPPVAFEGTLYDDYGFSDFRLGGETDDEIARMAKDLLDQTYAEIYTLLEEYKTALTKSIYVLLEAGELYAEDLEVLVEAYPPGTPLEAVESEEEPGEIPAWAQPMAVEAGTTKQEEEEGALEAGDGSALMLPAGIVSSEASLVEAEGGKIQAKDERQEEVEEGELEKSESVYSESEREPVQEEEGEREALFDGTDERDQEGSAVGATEMGEGKASLEEVGSSTIPEEHEEEWLSSSDVRNASDAAEDVDEGETRASDYVNNASQMMDADDRRLEPRGSGAPQVNGEPRIREGLPLNGTEAFGATESSEAEEQEAGGLSETTPSESPRRQGGGANEEANGASKLAADSPPAQPEPVASIRGAAENRTE